MFCSNCGFSLSGGKFCSNCGSDSGSSQFQDLENSNRLSTRSQPDELTSSRVDPLQVVAFIAFILVAIFAFWLYTRSTDLNSKNSGFTEDECYKIMVEAGAPEIVGIQVMCKMEFEKGQASFDNYMNSFIDANTTFEKQVKEITG